MKKWFALMVLAFPQNGAPDLSTRLTRINREQGLRILVTRESHCLQLDGRTAKCPQGMVRYFVSHWDHGHIPFFPPRNVECFVGTPPPYRFQGWRKTPMCTELSEISIVHEGVRDWDANRASRVFFLPRARILVLGDLPASELFLRSARLRLRRPDWVLLPRAGTIGEKEAVELRSLAPRLGFISSALNKRTFDPRGKIFLSAADWGNLVFTE